MQELTVATDVAAPADRVWQVITDLEGSPEVISTIEEVEILAGGDGFGLGTKWRETRTLFGREATEVMEVTAIDPGRSYTVEADGRGAHYTTTVSVEPNDGSGSRLSYSFGGEPKGTVGKLLAATIGRLFMGATRKALEKDLAELKAAAEKLA